MSPARRESRLQQWLGALIKREPVLAGMRPIGRRIEPVLPVSDPARVSIDPAPGEPTPVSEPTRLRARKQTGKPTPAAASPVTPTALQAGTDASEEATQAGSSIEPTPAERDRSSVFGVDHGEGPVPVSHQAWCWADDKLAQREPSEHARALLAYVQSDIPQILDFPRLLDLYCDMCVELAWQPHTWVKVARHFTKLSGGKQYRPAVDKRSGKREAKQRIYIIPGLSAHAAHSAGVRRPGSIVPEARLRHDAGAPIGGSPCSPALRADGCAERRAA